MSNAILVALAMMLFQGCTGKKLGDAIGDPLGVILALLAAIVVDFARIYQWFRVHP